MFYYRAVQYNRCLGLYFILPSRMLLFSRMMWKAQEVLCISGFVTHHLPIFHHANHTTTGARGNEIGDWLPPVQKQIAHSVWSSAIFTYAGAENAGENTCLGVGVGKWIWTRMGLIQISWKLGSPRFRNSYTKLFPNPFCPSSYLQWGPPADAFGQCWNGFAIGRLRHLVTS